MASVRRYAIGNYDVTHLSSWLYTSSTFNVLFTIGLYAVAALFFISRRQPMDLQEWHLFRFLPFDFVHHLGIVVFAIAGLFGAVNVLNMLWHMWREHTLNGEDPTPTHFVTIGDLIVTARNTVVGEILLWKRHRECDAERPGAWYVQPWFVHATMALGFLGMDTR